MRRSHTCVCGACTNCKISAATRASYRNGTRRALPYAWMAEEKAALRELCGQRPIRDIAAELARRFHVRRTHKAIEQQARRLGLYTILETLGQRDVARIFGGGRRQLYERLAGLGAMPINAEPDPRWGWRYDAAALERMMLAHSWAYDRTRVQGARWKVVAAAAHRRDPWLTIPEMAQAIGISPNTLAFWIRLGLVETKRQVLAVVGMPAHRMSTRQIDTLLRIKAEKAEIQAACFPTGAVGGRGRKGVAA